MHVCHLGFAYRIRAYHKTIAHPLVILRGHKAIAFDPHDPLNPIIQFYGTHLRSELGFFLG